MKAEICDKCGKVLEVAHDTKVPSVTINIGGKGLPTGTDRYLSSEVCAECFSAAPGSKEFYAYLVGLHENPVEYVEPTGKIVLEPNHARHAHRCAFENYGVCTCGLLHALAGFAFRDSWYPRFEAEWKRHSKALTGEETKV
jgi:hypothetical protein